MTTRNDKGKIAITSLRDILVAYDEMEADRDRAEKGIEAIVAALGFAPNAIPRRYLDAPTLLDAVLRVLDDANINAYDIANRLDRGDGKW